MSIRTLRRPLALSFLLIACAALVAACGSSDSKSDDSSSSKQQLGMDEQAACVVYGKDIASDDVRDLADQAKDAFVAAKPDVDPDDVDLDGYDGDLDTFEALALDTLVDSRIIAHAASRADVDVDTSDALDQLQEALGDTDLDVDDVLDAIEERSGLDRSTLERSALDSARQDAAFEELDGDEADRFDDSQEWLQDELRPAASDHVRCGSGIGWDEDQRDDIELPDGKTVSFSDLVDGLVGAAATDASKPDPTSLGIDYEDAVVPLIDDFTPLIQRFGSVASKLTSGSIDLQRVGEGLGRQIQDMEAVRARAAQVKIADPYLQRNHQHLVKSFDAYIAALTAIQGMTSATSQSQVDAAEQDFNAAISRADDELTAWGTGLDSDPQDRTFARSAIALGKLADSANAISG